MLLHFDLLLEAKKRGERHQTKLRVGDGVDIRDEARQCEDVMPVMMVSARFAELPLPATRSEADHVPRRLLPITTSKLVELN